MLFQPNFWNSNNIVSLLLLPLSYLYRILLLKNFVTRSKKVKLPVICVGNLTVGGAGKTPLVITLSKLFKNNGKRVAVLLRGYNGKLKGPLEVKKMHTTLEVGDEAKLHSLYNNTWIGKNKFEAAKLICTQKKFDLIILDDGLQNRKLQQDFKICVFDGKKGMGNERIFPAGPLREKLEYSINKIDYAIIVGDKNLKLEKSLYKYNSELKISYANFEIENNNLNIPKTKKVIAFAGIGIPEKFFLFLVSIGFHPIQTIIFSDHYRYSNSDILKLTHLALKKDAVLVTTSKDFTKINELSDYKKFKHIIFEIPVTLKLKKPNQLLYQIEKNLL